MVSTINTVINENNLFKVKEYACLSTDTKPTDGVTNGSALVEMDTGDVYMYDEEGAEWVQLCSLK